jgi:four helix bundle protein
MQDFRKLNIYKRAIEYCKKIYKFSTKLPSNEKYGLISQIRRAAISIPLNISEGSGCNTDKEFSQFISYAYRSINEVLTCLELSVELKLVYPVRNSSGALNSTGIIVKSNPAAAAGPGSAP